MCMYEWMINLTMLKSQVNQGEREMTCLFVYYLKEKILAQSL
jgi:hypothetical protein